MIIKKVNFSILQDFMLLAVNYNYILSFIADMIMLEFLMLFTYKKITLSEK